MKNLSKALLSLMIAISLTGCNQEKKVTKESLQSDEDKVSYSIGYDLGKGAKTQGIKVNPDAMREGIRHGAEGTQPLMTDQEMQQTMTGFRQNMAKKQEEKNKMAAGENKKTGEEFLAKKKTESGVKSTPSGLLYKVKKEGSGKSPKPTDQVTVHYKGTLIDGKEFDSSHKRNQPATFKLNQVIKGWTEGLQLMKEGAVYEFYIPSDLGYGERGAGEMIGPGATLIFEVELIKVG